MILAAETVTTLFSPFLQGGFAGMALLQLLFLFWINKRGLEVLKENNKVIAEHNKLMAMHYEKLGFVEAKIEQLSNRLADRPCQARIRIQKGD